MNESNPRCRESLSLSRRQFLRSTLAAAATAALRPGATAAAGKCRPVIAGSYWTYDAAESVKWGAAGWEAELDRQAAQHRLHLIAQYDPCPIARQTNVPVFGLSGFLDPIVPWPFVRRWLGKNCAALRDYKVIHSADHNVLGTAPVDAAKQILAWMNQQP